MSSFATVCSVALRMLRVTIAIGTPASNNWFTRTWAPSIHVARSAPAISWRSMIDRRFRDSSQSPSAVRYSSNGVPTGRFASTHIAAKSRRLSASVPSRSNSTPSRLPNADIKTRHRFCRLYNEQFEYLPHPDR